MLSRNVLFVVCVFFCLFLCCVSECRIIMCVLFLLSGMFYYSGICHYVRSGMFDVLFLECFMIRVRIVLSVCVCFVFRDVLLISGMCCFRICRHVSVLAGMFLVKMCFVCPACFSIARYVAFVFCCPRMCY